MAYMSQEKKAKIAASLKAVMPKGWKYSLSVRNHSTLVLKISAAPVDLCEEVYQFQKADPYRTASCPVEKRDHLSVNEYYLERQFSDSLPVFKKIIAAMNDGNHDNSDIQSDYFDVGFYTDIKIGTWDKPFKHTGAKEVHEA